MDINALRVFNSLYKLGITEEEFKEIEEEQRHEERTGLSVNLVKKGKIIGVSHDENHIIVIKGVKGEIKPEPKSRVLFKTLITFNPLPKEIYTLHQIAQYRALDTDIKHTATNLDQLKDRICDRFVDEYPKGLGDMYDDVYEYGEEKRRKNKKLKARLIIEQLTAIFWLFGEDFTTFKPTLTRKNIARIVKVFSRNNRRLAIIQINEKWHKQRGGMCAYKWTELIQRMVFKIRTFTPRDERYNYVCPDREIYLRDGYDDDDNDYESKSEIWLDDRLSGRVTARELGVLSRKLDDGWVFLTADEFNKQKSAIRVEMMSARREEQEDEVRDKLQTTILKQFRKSKVVRHGITFTKKSISYEGITVKGSKIGKYLTEQNIPLQEKPDFNDIFEGYVDYFLQLEVIHNCYDYSDTRVVCNFEGKETIVVGKIRVVVEQIGKNIFVNNRRICKVDLRNVVKSAINHDKQEEYNEWVKHTSRVNLALQEVLKQGAISFELKTDNTSDNCLIRENSNAKMLLSIPVTRRKGKNFAKINGNEYKIKNVKALFDLMKDIDSCRLGYSGGGYLQRTIKLLYRAIDGIAPKEIGELIKNGRVEYRKLRKKKKEALGKKIARSEEFLAHAVKLTKAKTVKGGYFVRGVSGTLYFVESKSLGVWTIKDGKQEQYLCIVDDDYPCDEDEDDKALTNDRIAKRLLMLSKDKVVAREIYEEGDRVDRHWLDIRQDVMGNSVVV